MDQIRLYIYGCLTCGIDSVYARKLKAHCLVMGMTLIVKNTKYDQSALNEHAAFLKGMGIPQDSYKAVVVEDDTVSLLREWFP